MESPIVVVPPDANHVPQTAPSASFEKADEKSTDINIKIYESARSELIQRIILRDSALGLYIASVGTYLASVVTAHYSKPLDQLDIGYAAVLQMPLPVICLVFSLVIVQHHLVIGRLGAFLRSELHWASLHNRISAHWDNSKAFLGQANFLILLRLFAQGLTLCLPLAYNVVFYLRFRNRSISLGWYWHRILLCQLLVDTLAIATIVWLHLYAHFARKKDW